MDNNKIMTDNNCRCCLNEFKEYDARIKITENIAEMFLNLTRLQLLDVDGMPDTICQNCNIELRRFSQLREEFIEKHKLGVQMMSVKNEDNFLIEDETNFIAMDISEHKEESPRCQKKSNNNKRHKKPEKRTLCGYCGNSYYKDQLQRHIDKVHFKIKRFFCDLCDFGAFLKCNLNTHMAKHVAKEFRKVIKCDYCPSTFTRQESLKNHIKTEHEEPLILVCFCGKQFNLRHKLTTHIKRTHNNIRDHMCNSCGKRYFTPKELKVHILKTHTPNYVDFSENYCEKCGKRYSSSKSLRTHMKHHQEPQFKCTFEGCQKAFITKLLLSNHEKIHLGQRDHMCHLCEKIYFSANHLRRHIMVFHDKVRVNCFIEGCRFSVGRKDYLRNHILTHRELSENLKKDYLIKIREMKFLKHY